jgi:hypothetical protein
MPLNSSSFDSQQSASVSGAPSFDHDRLTPHQAAAFLGLARQSLAIDRVNRRLGGVPFYKLGRLVFYRRSDLQRWVETRRVDAPDRDEP